MWRTCFLGLWLIGTAPALGMTVPALLWSDLASGAAIILFSALAMRHAWAAWTVCAVGLWVMSAPLLFWASNAAVYNNDLLTGALVVTFAVIVPQLGRDGPGSGAPPGWSYNPSGWVQRLGIVFLAMIGFFLSRYMAAFQLGHIVYPWDPFFGEGTRRVLTSDISKAFPVSDAGLGALSYLLDALAGLIGGRTAVAHHAVDGGALRFLHHSAWCDEHCAGDSSAGQYRRLVHAVSGGISGDAADGVTGAG